MEKLISIVVPAYNIKDYIHNCVVFLVCTEELKEVG